MFYWILQQKTNLKRIHRYCFLLIFLFCLCFIIIFCYSTYFRRRMAFHAVNENNVHDNVSIIMLFFLFVFSFALRLNFQIFYFHSACYHHLYSVHLAHKFLCNRWTTKENVLYTYYETQCSNIFYNFRTNCVENPLQCICFYLLLQGETKR